MNFAQALRLSQPSLSDQNPVVAFAGAGGKTTALFQLARQLSPAMVTTTTHLGAWQAPLADRHIVAGDAVDLAALEKDFPPGVTLVTGPPEGNRFRGVEQDLLYWLHAISKERRLPLLIEADGARQRPLKAPAAHEPVIPAFVEAVSVVAGLAGLGKPLTDEFVHRPEIFSQLSGLEMGQAVTPEAVVRVLAHPSGGLKSIPPGARRVALLNQADTAELQAQAKRLAEKLLPAYDAVLVASLGQNQTYAAHEPVAGIVLAAGESKRFGQPKQLLEWRGKPFVRQAAETALAAGLSPVVVVTGANAGAVGAAVGGLPLTICHNPDWQSGQSSSLQAGLSALPPKTGAAIFLLADQPHVPPTLLRALVERHSLDLSPVVAPQVGGRRANPVLFDRVAFPALRSLSGDVGGRAVFDRFPPAYLPWHDESLLADIDTPEDYARLEP